MRASGWFERWRARRADMAVVAFVAVFFTLFFARVFAGHRLIIKGDAFFYTYPLRTIAWDMIRAGQLPLWTPLMLSGYPLLSVALLAIGYPLTWGHVFLPGHWAEQAYALAPFLLSPLTTYAYAREIGRSRLAALLAGLSFGYGGMMCGILAHSGMLTNGLMWAPLVLVFIDRARRRSFAHCLFWATVAYAMSVLAGHGQSYVYTGTLAFAYGVFTSLVLVFTAKRNGNNRAWRAWLNWRPLVVTVGAMILAAGLAAFQLLETLRAARRSVRSELTYEVFSEGSFNVHEALLSLGAQLYHYVDTGTYVTPLALVLALIAVGWAVRMRCRDTRIWFWILVAVVAFVLLLGSNTPINRIVYHVPVLNVFRVPSRHTFEWTLALSVLAAYGWDAAADYFKRCDEHANKRAHAHNITVVTALLLLIMTGVVGALWWGAIVQWPEPNPTIFTRLPERSYWLWKLAFSLLVLALAWCAFKLSSAHLRIAVLSMTIALACFVEAHATAACWWAGFVSLPAARFHVVSGATRYLQQFPPAENRVYTRVAMFSEEFNDAPRLEAANLTMLYGLHNVAGMEPLILARYSRALGDVGPDSVTPRAGRPPNDDLLSARSHVLDLLNTTHLITYAGTLGILEDPVVRREGIAVSRFDLDLNLPPGATAHLTGAAVDSDQLALVTSLANSVTEPHGSVVAHVHVLTEDGRTVELTLRAGIDTAEWAHERADVRPMIAHGLAAVFDSRADKGSSFTALRYWTRLPLGPAVRVRRVEITNVARGATLAIWKASLANARNQTSTLLARDTRSEAWDTVYEYDRVQILRNTRALPRAWLVAEAEAVDGEEALRRIRGESLRPFDPRRTALLEVRADELPQLSGGPLPADSSARVLNYEPTRLVIETNASTPTVLVVSEIFYPGWEARVDGGRAPILLTDYLLRGIALPAGRHTIEMRYTAPAARAGMVISACTLLLLGGLFIYTRRQRRMERAEA